MIDNPELKKWRKVNMKKIFAIAMGLLLLSLLGISVSAETVTDQTSDVYHWHQSAGSYGWEANVGNKPNIDIEEVSYDLNNDKLTLSIKVVGTISSSEMVSYWCSLNSSNSNYYFGWEQGTGTGFGISSEGSYQMVEPEITVSDDTLTAIFDKVGTLDTGVEFYGWSAEYTSYGDTSNEWWGDWAPESYAAYDGADSEDNSNTDDATNGDDTDNTDSETVNPVAADGDNQNKEDSTDIPSDTPGFGFIALITALAAIVLIFKKKI